MRSLPRSSTMLTCSRVSAAAVCRKGHPLLLRLPSLSPSSSQTYFFSLKPCVQNLTNQQWCFISSSSTAAIMSTAKYHYQQPSLQTIFTKRRKNHCCSLNHHISFHYINSIHHFHQSTAASELTNGSNNSLRHVEKPELSATTSGLHEIGEEDENDVGVEFEDEDENLKQQVWEKGPALLPTFNVGAYANESENVKKLIQLGVDLSRWEGRYGTIPLLYKSDFDTTMKPIIDFLIDAGVPDADLSRILTKNPFILNEDVRNLEKRLEYLRLKKFSPKSVLDIIARNPYWLSFSVPRIDRRLGFFQTYFNLTGDQVRALASVGSSGPQLITYHLGRVKDVTFTIKEEMGFTSKEIVKLLLTRPRIWKETTVSLRRRFDYLHNEEKFSHADVVRCPMLLLTRERRLRERIGFLREVGRAQFSPKQPNYISSEMLVTGTDAEFATDVAKVGVIEYNNYLKTL